MEMIPIALVDDHRLFRGGIASLISDFKKYQIIFEASDGLEMMAKLNGPVKPKMVLLDINMPRMDGVAAAKKLRELYPDIAIIILSMYGDEERVLTMIKMGVKGYLLKDSEPHEFENALLKVAEGEVYYPDFVTRHLINSFNAQPHLIKLNQRELEFLKYAGTELTYKEIADAMNVSARTVDGYRDQLFEKLQIKSRVGLVLYAIKNKLIDL